MSKQRYRLVRIQDLKHGNIVYDETFKRNIRLVGDAYQEGEHEGQPAWKFRYCTLHRQGASRAVAWGVENQECFVYSLSLQSVLPQL